MWLHRWSSGVGEWLQDFRVRAPGVDVSSASWHPGNPRVQHKTHLTHARPLDRCHAQWSPMSIPRAHVIDFLAARSVSAPNPSLGRGLWRRFGCTPTPKGSMLARMGAPEHFRALAAEAYRMVQEA